MLIAFYFSVVERKVYIQNENHSLASFLQFRGSYGHRDNNRYTLRRAQWRKVPLPDWTSSISSSSAAQRRLVLAVR